MTKFLAACALGWPLWLATATYATAHHYAPGFTAATYFIAGRVCHQRPERSFHSAAVQWPVCARCSGLYLAAPLGAVAAVTLGARRRRPSVAWLAAWALPTAVTFGVEHIGLAPLNNLIRFAAAVPLGAAIAWVIVRTADSRAGIE